MSETITTIEEGKQFLTEHWLEGVCCPVCMQKVKLYKRPLNSQMARALLLIYRHFAADARLAKDSSYWLDVNDFLLQCGVNSGEANVALLRHWALIERKPERQKDGNRAGLYRITELGCRFSRGAVTVPKYVLLFNDRLYEPTKPFKRITVKEALGEKFNYEELTAGIVEEIEEPPPFHSALKPEHPGSQPTLF